MNALLALRAQPPERLVMAVLLVIFVASFARNLDEHGDFAGYLEVGELVLQGRDIYAEARPGVNTWPPFFSVACVPLALIARLSGTLVRALWLLLNGWIVYELLRVSVWLVYRRPLTISPRADGITIASAVVLGPLVLASRFVLGNLDRLQINMLILYACLWGCVAIVRGRPGRGGAVIGLAAAVKVLPVFLVAYFAWKRWWRACAGAVIAGALSSLVPILVFGPRGWWDYVQRWLAIASGGWPVRKGNQSVYAMVDRFYSHRDSLRWPEVQHLVASDDPWVTAIVSGLLALVVLALVVGARGASRSSGTAAVPVEMAIVLATAILFSPLAWKHYFVFLLPAYVVLWRAAFVPSVGGDPDGYTRLGDATRRGLRWVLGIAFALSTLTVRGLVGKPAGIMFEAASALTAGALVVLVGLLVLRAALSERPT
jgi:hypothetical protein